MADKNTPQCGKDFPAPLPPYLQEWLNDNSRQQKGRFGLSLEDFDRAFGFSCGITERAQEGRRVPFYVHRIVHKAYRLVNHSNWGVFDLLGEDFLGEEIKTIQKDRTGWKDDTISILEKSQHELVQRVTKLKVQLSLSNDKLYRLKHAVRNRYKIELHLQEAETVLRQLVEPHRR